MTCGCVKNIETELSESIGNEIDSALIYKLKCKVICEYNKFLCRLFKGYTEDYSMLINEINLIDLIENYNYNLLYTLGLISFFLNNSSGIKFADKCIDRSFICKLDKGGSFENEKGNCNTNATSSFDNTYEK